MLGKVFSLDGLLLVALLPPDVEQRAVVLLHQPLHVLLVARRAQVTLVLLRDRICKQYFKQHSSFTISSIE